MKIDTQINYDITTDKGSLTISVSNASLDDINQIVTAIKNMAAGNSECMRRRVLYEVSQYNPLGGPY